MACACAVFVAWFSLHAAAAQDCGSESDLRRFPSQDSLGLSPLGFVLGSSVEYLLYLKLWGSYLVTVLGMARGSFRAYLYGLGVAGFRG